VRVFLSGPLLVLGMTALLAGGEATAPSAGSFRKLLDALRRADLVVKGRVSAVTENPSGALTFRIQVSVVLKGEAKGELTVRVTKAPADGMAAARPVPDTFALFFLGESAAEKVPIDPNDWWISVREGREAAAQESNTPLARVRSELLFTCSGPKGPSCLQAIRALGRLPPEPRTVQVLGEFREAEEELAGAALEALLLLNQPEAVQLTAAYLTRVEAIPEARRSGALVRQSEAILEALAGLTAEEAVQHLAALLSHSDVRLRRAASLALSRIPEGACIPFLVRVLDDTDQEVRYHGVSGLARITLKRDWGPPLPAFRKDEQKYVAFWKSWWESEARAAFSTRARER
jgi:hypothetical protein